MSRHIESITPAVPGWWVVEPVEMKTGPDRYIRFPVVAWAMASYDGDHEVVAMVPGDHTKLFLANPEGWLEKDGTFEECQCSSAERRRLHGFCSACGGEYE